VQLLLLLLSCVVFSACLGYNCQSSISLSNMPDEAFTHRESFKLNASVAARQTKHDNIAASMKTQVEFDYIELAP
jgi:hypothetical protein